MKRRDSAAPTAQTAAAKSGSYPLAVPLVDERPVDEPVRLDERLAPRRVIIAEDDEGFRSAVAARLRAEGHVVVETHDGGELRDALDATSPGYFDVVIADHRMPRVSGLEVLARAGARAPFVLVTGLDDEQVRASAEKFGAAALLQKPVDLDHLMEVVDRLLRTGARSE
jgi:DNA-binding response OmpR family regulator